MRDITRILYGVLMVTAGILHFVKKSIFILIMPRKMPFKSFLVLFTGICEILAGIALLLNASRRLAGILLTIFMVMVYPVNIYMAFKKKTLGKKNSVHPIILWLRLPLQYPLIAGAYRWSKTETKNHRIDTVKTHFR